MERFLWDLANLADDAFRNADTRLLRKFELRYSDILFFQLDFAMGSESEQRTLIDNLPWDISRPKNASAGHQAQSRSSASSIRYSARYELRRKVRDIWLMPDRRGKEWYAFRMIESAGIAVANVPPYEARLERDLGTLWSNARKPVPPLTAIELCLRHLIAKGDKARICQNKDCDKPYYFATRRSQKYCSERCALPAQRKFKRDWWNRSGKQRRARQRSSNH
jgi:hypothetical protein